MEFFWRGESRLSSAVREGEVARGDLTSKSQNQESPEFGEVAISALGVM